MFCNDSGWAWWGLLLCAVAGSPAGALETVIRCQLPDGRVSFSDRPCRTGVQDELEIRDRRVGWEAPRTPWKIERQSPRERQRAVRGRAAALRAARKERARKKRDCWNKSAQIDRIQERLRRGYRAGQGRTMRYRQRELEAYIREFCQ